jgi:hypothetical protein
MYAFLELGNTRQSTALQKSKQVTKKKTMVSSSAARQTICIHGEGSVRFDKREDEPSSKQ